MISYYNDCSRQQEGKTTYETPAIVEFGGWGGSKTSGKRMKDGGEQEQAESHRHGPLKRRVGWTEVAQMHRAQQQHERKRPGKKEQGASRKQRGPSTTREESGWQRWGWQTGSWLCKALGNWNGHGILLGNLKSLNSELTKSDYDFRWLTLDSVLKELNDSKVSWIWSFQK